MSIRVFARTALAVLLIHQLSSCTHDNNELSPQNSVGNKSEVGYLSGEKVVIPQDVDPAAIQIMNKDEAIKYVANTFGDKGGRRAALSEMDPEALSRLLLEKKKSYPTLDFSLDELPADQFGRIRKDFPDIKTQKEAYDKRETIALYYENRLRHDFLKAAKEKGTNIPVTSGGRVKAPLESNELPGGWGWLAATYTVSCANALSARTQVNAETSARFQEGNKDGFRSNAFRHSGWCGLVARKNIAGGANKQNGVGEAGIVCSSFECVSVNFDPSQPNSIFMVQTRNKEAAMDLYNNSIGRSYIYHNTTFGLFGVRKNFPSEGYFLNVMRDRNCNENAFLPTATSVEQILGYVQSNPEDAWQTLYRHTESGWYSFVRLYDGQLCN